MAVVGTWNVENLFRPGGEFGPKDQQVYSEKLAALADVINTVAPDVMGLQEIGSPDALADLVALLEGEWHTAVSTLFEPHRQIRVAVVARHPVQVVDEVIDFPPGLAPLRAHDDPAKITSRMGRGALAVRVDLAGEDPITVVSCHLKSKLLSFPPTSSGKTRFQPRDEGERARYAAYALYRRTAEAVTVRAFADHLLDRSYTGPGTGPGTGGDGNAGSDEGPGRAGVRQRLVVVGDLNDEPKAATTQILLGPPGSELGTSGAGRPDKGDAFRLWNLASLLDPATGTRVYRGRPELIDHILVSRALIEDLDHGDVWVDTPTEALPSITDNPTERRTHPGSDHSPVFARL